MAVSWIVAANMTEEMVKVLETNLPAVVGAILGGIIAAATFLFIILRDFTNKKIIESTNDKKSNIANQYKKTAKSVKQDLFILTLCLLFSVGLPIFKLHPTNSYIVKINILPDFTIKTLITSLEVFTLILSIAIIWEIIDTMFLALQGEI